MYAFHFTAAAHTLTHYALALSLFLCCMLFHFRAPPSTLRAMRLLLRKARGEKLLEMI